MRSSSATPLPRRKSSPVTDPRAQSAERGAQRLGWFLASAVVLAASVAGVRFRTPIDQAVPIIVLFIFAWSWCVRTTRWCAAVQLAIPVLIVAEMLPVDEALRLAVIGIVTAFAFAAALLAKPEIEMRWLPSRDVGLFRELLVLGGAWLIVAAFQWRRVVSPMAIAVAVITALLTPAVPLRTVAFPYLIAILAAIAHVRHVRFNVVGAALCAFVLALFPWSGVVARGAMYVMTRHRSQPREGIYAALPAGHSIDVWLPQYAESLVVSGANISRLRPRTTLGWIDPGHVAIRVGDASDWGYMRREHFFAARNELPRDPAGKIRDYGYSSWVDGAGRIALPVRRGTIRVTADPRLPKGALLQIESVELTRR
jgi:hypothetical protein